MGIFLSVNFDAFWNHFPTLVWMFILEFFVFIWRVMEHVAYFLKFFKTQVVNNLKNFLAVELSSFLSLFLQHQLLFKGFKTSSIHFWVLTYMARVKAAWITLLNFILVENWEILCCNSRARSNWCSVKFFIKSFFFW